MIEAALRAGCGTVESFLQTGWSQGGNTNTFLQRKDDEGNVNRTDRQSLLRHPLFQNLSEAALDALLGGAKTDAVPSARLLLAQGAPVSSLIVVLEGVVELTTQRDGHEATMALIRPVDFFVLAGCLHNAPSPFAARTLAPSRVVSIPAQNVQDLCEQDHGFALGVIRELAECHYNLIHHAVSLKLETVRQRLAAYLLRLAGRADGAGGGAIVLPAEKRVLASYLGMTPETLSRMFRSLRDCGVIVDGQNVRLTDTPALARAAAPETGAPLAAALVQARPARRAAGGEG